MNAKPYAASMCERTTIQNEAARLKIIEILYKTVMIALRATVDKVRI